MADGVPDMTRGDWIAFSVGTLIGLTVAAIIGQAQTLWLRGLDRLDDAICRASNDIGADE
jgi:hypothetical protein